MRPTLRKHIAIGWMLSVAANFVYAGEFRQYTYLEETGAVESSHIWLIRRSGTEIETRWIAPDKAYLNLCDETGNTQEWRVRDSNTDISAKRLGRIIRFEGTYNGEQIRRDVEIDESPWFQPLSYALGRFSQSHLDSIVFWTIRPDNLDVVKLRAKSAGEEQVITKAGRFPANKVSISLMGLLSHFWKAHYWFRRADGLFVRYEGANGLPGTPTTTIQLGG
jgi:hypothetical protein